MKEFIHLFTSITEKLPENKTQGFAYRHDRVLAGLFMMYSNTPAIDCGGGNIEYYTHWLDLSALTTKERANNAIFQCYDDTSDAWGAKELLNWLKGRIQKRNEKVSK